MDRRRFLHVIGGSVVAQACGPTMTSSSAPLKAVDVKLGSLVALANVSAFVGRDAMGLYAMNGICTHAQCDISKTGKILSGPKLQCTCHGSEFDANGTVLNPPATQSLDHIALTIGADGTISVNTSSVVPATTRVQG